MKTDWRINDRGEEYRTLSWKEEEDGHLIVCFQIQRKVTVPEADQVVTEGRLSRMEAGDLVLALLEVLLP